MSNIEKNISNFIETQFPAVFREEGPLFVEFVKQYYEWIESSNNAIYHARRMLEYKDIDQTVDDFVIKFKQKYLSDIQLDTVAQTRNLVKNSLDLYRSKGTERSVDLFFRAVFGKPAEVYYPGEDIFRLSDGKWVKPKYLEVTPSNFNYEFVGKQVQGVNTGATAFVERYIRRKVKNKYINVLYISAINGEFETGELLTLFGQSLKGIPTIIGSLTTLQIVTGGSGFKVGDIVSLQSNSGLQGKARVSSISDIIGIVDFKLQESGWGYSTNSQVLISENVLTLENVRTLDTKTNTQFTIFETIKQPLANIVYQNANNTFAPIAGDVLFTYYSNNSVAGKGLVLTASASGNTNGEIYILEQQGDLGFVYEPNANLAGDIFITPQVGVVAGYSNVQSGCNVVQGTGTTFTSLQVGAIIEFFEYDANNDLITSETRRVTNIVDDDELEVDSDFENDSAFVLMQIVGNRIIVGTSTSFNTDFVYGDKIAIYTNSSSYFMRTVNAVTNSTYMSVQEPITIANSAANYANLSINKYIYNQSNTIVANIVSRTDKSVTANVMGVSSNLTLKISNVSSIISNTQIVYQLNANNTEIANARIFSTQTSGSNASIFVVNSVGVFLPNTTLLRVRELNSSTNTSIGHLDSVDMNIGVINTASAFVSSNSNFIYGVNSQTTATITRLSSGIFANFNISNTLQFSETLTVFPDYIRQYANVPLNSQSFGFPENPSANVTTQYLEDILGVRTLTIGGISSLVNINPGKNYDIAPYVTIYDQYIASRSLPSQYSAEIGNTTGIFADGELVEQTNGNLAQVIQANNTVVILKRLKFVNNFDTSLALTGISTGVSANIISVSEIQNIESLGLNAVVTANVQTGKGSVTTLDVIDSGFGYLNNETLSFFSNDRTLTGTAKALLQKKGVSEGFYRNRNGFVSDSKYIFDGEYYQDYSYEVRTSVTADKYAEILKNVLHVAGTKTFYAVILSETANTSINIKTEITEE